MNGFRDKKVIVIGAGLGGISAAVSLRTAGFDVDVYEKNDRVGGKLNLLEKEGFRFDLGPSILTMPHIFERLFEFAGRKMSDFIKIREPGVHWRCFFEDGMTIDLFRRIRDTARKNPHLNREEIDELGKFQRYAGELYGSIEKGYLRQGIDTFWEAVRFYGIKSSVRDFDIFSTMNQGVCRYISNEYLQHVMNFFAKYVGSSPYNAPAVLNMLPYIQLRFGLWYVNGGMYNLARALENLMKETGVNIFLNSEVVRLEKKGRAIKKAVLNTGKKVDADIFVSNMEVVPAYSKLTEERQSFLERYKKFEPACSGLVMHLGVKKRYPHLAHHNFFFSRNPEKYFDEVFRQHILPEDPTIYLVASTRTDKSQAPAGCENIKILPHIPYIQDNPFTREDYLDLRKRVLDKLERMGLEGIRKNTVVQDVWTPEDIRKRYYSSRGAIYGVVSDKKKNRGFKVPKKSRRYSNLFFTGGSVNPGGGMPMVVLSGQQVRDMILRNERL